MITIKLKPSQPVPSVGDVQIITTVPSALGPQFMLARKIVSVTGNIVKYEFINVRRK